MKAHLREQRNQILQYFPADNNDGGRRLVLNTCNQNVFMTAVLEVKIWEQIDCNCQQIKQLEFLSEELDKLWLA
jgi:hypothetical protein